MVAAQFLASVVGVVFSIVLMRVYFIDYRYATTVVDAPRQFVARSNIIRECSTLISQMFLLAVGVSYAVFPPSPSDYFSVFEFREFCLLSITLITACKPIRLLYDRKRLVVLLSK